MKYLNGKRLRRAVNAGWLWLENHRDSLNAINVFPVADGDTGTNMALTLKAAVSGANTAKSDSLQDVADSIALHSLRGAQGNSGVILSQYFKGVAEYIRRRDRLYTHEVAGVFSAGATSAYGALKDPKEGTILTVIREMAEHLQQTKKPFSNMMHLMQSAIERGRQSLAETKSRLKVLADADVVDAGGQGFVHFIEGIYQFIKSGNMPSRLPEVSAGDELPKIVEEHSAFRYCTEFLVKGSEFDTEGIKSRLEGFGDSLIVASTGRDDGCYLRIHIHTDTPEPLREIAVSLGELETEKIDDMKSQNTAMRAWRAKFRRKSVKTIRIVTDSTCDLPRETAQFYDIDIIPLKVTFGSSIYKDGIDLEIDRFYGMLEKSSELPKTSQPSPGECEEFYDGIYSRGDCDHILSIHLSSKLSGTLNSAMMAGGKFDNKITHYDSGTVSLGLGIMVIAAAEMARKGKSLQSIIELLDRLKQNQKLFFTLGSIEYLIKGGRVGGAKAFLGRILGLKPLLSLVDGEIVPLDKARSEEKLLERIIAELPPDSRRGRLAVGHAAAPERMDEIVTVIRKKLGVENILTGEIGPTVGTHAGPGSWGIFYTKG